MGSGAPRGVKRRLEGLYTAMVSPFREGHLDESGFVENLEFQLSSGVDGIVVCGSTGEGSTLTDHERRRLIELAVDKGKNKVQIGVGTGGSSTSATIAQTQLAKELGANFALVVAPYYNRPTQKGIFQHYEAIAKAVDIPILIYNIPHRTGVNIDPLTVRELASISGIVGIKEASGSITQMGDILYHVKDDYPEFVVLSGDDIATLPLLALGGHGLISTLSNLTPVPVAALLSAWFRRDLNEARRIHFMLLPLFKAMGFETNPIPLKAAMNICGLAAGSVRLPLTPLSEAHMGSLKQLLLDAGLIPAGV